MHEKNSDSKFIRFIDRYWPQIIGLGGLIVFWDALSIVVDKVILPITSRIKNDDWLVQIVLILLAIVVYIVKLDTISKKTGSLQARILNIISCIVALIFIRNTNQYEFFGLTSFWGIHYVETIVFTVILLNLHVIFKIVKDRIRKNQCKISGLGFFSDLPSEDDHFDRKRYAIHLIDEIISSHKNGIVKHSSFSILLSERYGMGKSSFINLLKDNALRKPLCVVDFKPWLSHGSDQIIVNFFELLRTQFGNRNRKLSRLLRSYAILATESTYGKSITSVVNDHFVLDDSIEGQYESIKKELKCIGQPILVIVDDVDRLQSEELMTLIKLLRNTADFPNIFYLVAADKIAISESIRPFNIGDVDLYLKKFFNLELLFPADDNCLRENLAESITDVLQKFAVDQAEIKHVIEGVLKIKDWNEIFLNVRDVIRFKNQVVFNLGILNDSDLLKEIDLLDFYLLSIIQYMDVSIYKILRDTPIRLLDMLRVDERYTLKKDFKEAFRTEETKRMFKNREEYKKDIYEKEESAQKDKENKYKDIHDVVTYVMSKKNDILSQLFNELFVTGGESISKARIFYYYEYFKYFSGKYRKDELSDDEAYRIIRLPEKDFENAIDTIVKERKDYSLIFKCRFFIENENYNRLNVLKNILLLFDASCRINGYENSGMNELDYFRSLNLHTLIIKLYSKLYSRMNRSNNINYESEEHQLFFSEDKRFNLLAIVLKLLTEDPRYKIIFGDSNLKKWVNDFMDRYIREQLSSAPFESNTVKSIYLVRQISSGTWDKKLSEYIKRVKETIDPLEWLFRLVKYESDGSMRWNYDFINGVGIESYDFIRYANTILGDFVSDELRTDLLQLSQKPSNKKIDVNEHPFFKQALEWWKKKNQADIII